MYAGRTGCELKSRKIQGVGRLRITLIDAYVERHNQ